MKYYLGILSNRGKLVSEEDAYEYAMNEVMTNEEDMADFEDAFECEIKDIDEEEKEEFVEWFFSGNWVSREAEYEEELHDELY